MIQRKIAVLGGGSSGLPSVKVCLEEGFEVVCYEMQDELGGLWRYHEEAKAGLASIMKSTIINTSKEMSAYSDFPPPATFPNYMHNSMMITYFEMYAEKFNLRKHIRFRHEVLEVRQTEDYNVTGKWVVKLKDLSTNKVFEEIFDGVMVCTGHHAHPDIPIHSFKGVKEFHGKILHSHSYKRPAGFEDTKVVIVGVGNSAGDIAVELSSTAKKVYLSTRSGCWIMHRVGPNGLPFDTTILKRYFSFVISLLPYALSTKIFESQLNNRFNHELYNLKPKHRAIGQHPMTNDSIPNKILAGTVVIKSNIHHFTTKGVVFVGEEDVEYECDTVILATGYTIKFPFLSKDIINTENNRCNLYKYVFPPGLKHPSLCFIALVQSVGAFFPVAENQARWFVQTMAGNVKLPNKKVMMKDIKRNAEALSARYGSSSRYTIQADWITYMDEIASLYGAKPNLVKLLFMDPKLFWACISGPCLPYQYRLHGPGCWEGARKAILEYEERLKAPFNTKLRSNQSKMSCQTRFLIIFILAGFLVLCLAQIF